MQVTNEQVLALSGIFQAVSLVKQLAWTGKCNEQAMQVSIRSLLQISPKTTIQVYGTEYGCKHGLEILIQQFTNKLQNEREIPKYLLSLLYLEKKLRNQPEMLQTLSQGIKRAEAQAGHFSLTHNNVLANLSSLYTDTISSFRFRIQITGEASHLTNPIIINKIRSCLLAGIRSTVLWRQLGGTRWQFLLQRKQILHTAKIILHRAMQSTEQTQESETTL